MSSWLDTAQRFLRRLTSAVPERRPAAPTPDRFDARETHGRRNISISQPSTSGSAVCKPRTDSAKINESATQFPGDPTETTDLVIGLDFGTSSTKVVVRSPFAFDSLATAVRWPVGNGGATYLMPTVLYENARGDFSLEQREAAICTRTDLKIDLMDEPGQCEARARAAAYIGLTLRTARQWLLDTQKDIYGQFRLQWALNMGIPSAGYDDEPVREAFRLVARAAWILSLRPNLPTVVTAIEALRVAKGELESGVTIKVVPEIAAEVVGYARSHRRNDGLHVMVDVGASTLDICGFVLHAPDGDDQYELLTALVKRLGVHELHLRRLGAINDVGGRVGVRVPSALEPFEAVPRAGSEYVDAPSDPLRERLNEIDSEYKSNCANALGEVLKALRQRRDPKSPRWTSGLPVFVAGGGSRFRLVNDAIEECDIRLRNGTDTQGIDRQRLATLETLTNKDIPDQLAGRLDVAYGLSFDALDIGQITPPGEIDDVPETPPRQRNEAPSKDQV